ncbi:uncharacterized protein A4U43_C07F16860 [Asparagus officinalis]|uniref:Uncharacterized protein n=1 Tax=Asparagus officinalis TaxID=4686 RepID=A0A5P1ECU8_ASPOF|nr:uncharacterized protein A4U43_C07F16860 [Asparagus officinalis]
MSHHRRKPSQALPSTIDFAASDEAAVAGDEDRRGGAQGRRGALHGQAPQVRCRTLVSGESLPRPPPPADALGAKKKSSGRKSKNVIPSTFVPERRILVASNQPPHCTRSEPPHPEPSSIAQPDQLESPQTIASSVGSVPSTSRNVRCATRGKGIERLVRQLGHAISVPIPSSSGAPEGEHATSLANEIGKEIRTSAPVSNCGWDNIDAGIREAIIMRVRTKSDKAKVSRSKLPYNHISGSRSFAAAMSLIKIIHLDKNSSHIRDLFSVVERICSKPEAYEMKIGEQTFRRPGDPPLEEVIEMLRRKRNEDSTLDQQHHEDEL